MNDHTFDQRGRPTSSMYMTGAGAVGGAGSQPYSYTMSYLGNGSVSSAADSVVGTINVGSSGYDNLNRLTALSYTGGAYGGISAAWTYDNFGNQTSQTLSGSSSTPVPSNTTTHYDAQNHISFTSRDSNALPYDGDGNMYYDVQYAYAFDAENRLCAIKSGNTYKIYVYDPDGNRIAKGNISPVGNPNPPTAALCNPLDNSFSITQAYAIGKNGEEIENYTPGETWHNTNVYANGTLIATYAGNYISVPMTDWQGTRRAQLENTQSMSNIMEFISLPYGDGFTMVGGTTFDTLVQYTQQQYNQEDNLYNFKARYLGDWVGRFMSPDPWPGSLNLSNPQSLDRYSYVLNNPLSFVDPNGLDCVYLNDAGSGVGPSGIGSDGGSVDHNSNFNECVGTDASGNPNGSNGGYWVNGTVNASDVNANPDTGQVTVGNAAVYSVQGGALVTSGFGNTVTVNGTAPTIPDTSLINSTAVMIGTPGTTMPQLRLPALPQVRAIAQPPRYRNSVAACLAGPSATMNTANAMRMMRNQPSDDSAGGGGGSAIWQNTQRGDKAYGSASADAKFNGFALISDYFVAVGQCLDQH